MCLPGDPIWPVRACAVCLVRCDWRGQLCTEALPTLVVILPRIARSILHRRRAAAARGESLPRAARSILHRRALDAAPVGAPRQCAMHRRPRLCDGSSPEAMRDPSRSEAMYPTPQTLSAQSPFAELGALKTQKSASVQPRKESLAELAVIMTPNSANASESGDVCGVGDAPSRAGTAMGAPFEKRRPSRHALGPAYERRRPACPKPNLAAQGPRCLRASSKSTVSRHTRRRTK